MVHGVRKPAGQLIVSGEDSSYERDTLQCCHCGKHWIVVRGSGRERGFCLKCMGPTCGGQSCVECLPYMKRIELMEK